MQELVPAVIAVMAEQGYQIEVEVEVEAVLTPQ
jgi:hypothetical protein